MSYVPRSSPRVPLVAYLIPLVLLGVAVVVWWRWIQGPTAADAQVAPRTAMSRGELYNDEKDTIAIYNRTKKCVVNITSLRQSRNAFTMNVQNIPEGTGSGIVWDKAGHIVTNFHVIRNAQIAQVTLDDHSSWRAQLVGASPDNDLAVLKIDAPADRLLPIPLGKSSDLQVGQRVYAIGNPFGLDHSLTTGIISAVNREIEALTGSRIEGAIQTDAAINPGNSGGPLLDSEGLLIGLNTAIISPNGGSAGIGFAIPVDEVRRVVTELIQNGKVVRPSLGVKVADLGTSGVLVYNVVPDSPAEKAGLRPTRYDDNGKIVYGDVIEAVDDARVTSFSDLLTQLAKHKVGDNVKLTIIRDGKRQTVEVKLGPS